MTTKPNKPKTAKDGTSRGRPSEYNPEFIDSIIEYLLKFDFKEDETNYKKEIIPTIEGFARFINVGSKKTLYNWAEKHKDFLHALDEIKNLQAIVLQNGGLAGVLNATITKLMLSANHDMKEKSDITTDGERLPSAADAIAAITANK